MIDVGLEPYERLSNFHPYHFLFRGVECGSMEGLLQSLKFPLPEKQMKVAKLVGLKAKRVGKKKKWFIDHKLYWQGEPICRFSEEYKLLLLEAFTALFEQSEQFRTELLKTGTEQLIHSVGKQSEKFTVLTEDEFVSILSELRDRVTSTVFVKQEG
ncbi:TPA: hypothetical protein ACNPUU_002786 [Escherichia coli]